MRRVIFALVLGLPAALGSQTPVARTVPDGVVLTYSRFADIFGGRLIAAFDSIPESKYSYRPMPVQQTIGYIAQHLENANYELCQRLGPLKWVRTAKDSLADTVKAKWPKDTLVARLKTSLDFCERALGQLPRVDSPALASTLLAFETDLAEHYSQLSVYMRLIGLVPPSALPPKQRVAINVAATNLTPYAGSYELASGLEIDVTMRDGTLFAKSNAGGEPVRLWPETQNDFFVKEADVQVTFKRDASGTVSGLILHQFGRDRQASKTK